MWWWLYFIINVIIGMVFEFKFESTGNEYYRVMARLIAGKTGAVLFFFYPF
jgi:hypothetical protein